MENKKKRYWIETTDELEPFDIQPRLLKAKTLKAINEEAESFCKFI